MNFKNTDTHYNTLSIALHWLMFILIVTVYGSIELRELFDKGTETRDAFKNVALYVGFIGASFS